MRAKSSWKDYFVFSKKERTVVIFLLFVFVSYGLFLIFYNPETKPPVIENLDEKIASLSSQNKMGNDSTFSDASLANAGSDNDENEIKSPISLFAFDPNTLDESGFQRLGLRDKTIHTIINYRSKGGQFRKPEDLRKIYGLREEEANRLIPYVRITAQKTTNYNTRQYTDENEKQPFYNKPKPQIIDINTANVEQWKMLPAIGDVLSNRIVKYRDKMGGFSSVEQVKKTYSLSDSAYEAIRPYLSLSANKTTASLTTVSSDSKGKININTASVNDLKSNASIPSDIAEAIVVYRKQHGNYSSVEDIKKIVFINNEMYQKISSYLTTE